MGHDKMEGQGCRTAWVARRGEACMFCAVWDLHWGQQVIEKGWVGVFHSHEAMELDALYFL